MLLRRSRRAGLSLLEVIIATAVFLFSLVSLAYLLNISGNLAMDAHYKSHAANLAAAKLAEVAAGAEPLESQNDAPFEDDPDYTWTLQAESSSAGLYNVTVTVSRKRPDGTMVESSLSQMILDPMMVGSVFDTPATITEAEEAGAVAAESSTTASSTSSASTSSTSTASTQSATKSSTSTATRSSTPTATKSSGTSSKGGTTSSRGGGTSTSTRGSTGTSSTGKGGSTSTGSTRGGSGR